MSRAASCLWVLLWSIYSLVPVLGLNQEGLLLLAFKYAILSDPVSALGDWNILDSTPCGWNGVTCAQVSSSTDPTVISLILTQRKLVGCIPPELGSLQHLRHLDLSGNEINCTIPSELFKAQNLSNLVLANNAITGTLPASIEQLAQLQVLDLSNNALTGIIPNNITKLSQAKSISLNNNYFSGPVPKGFGSLASLEDLDLSSNLLNGSIPADLGNLKTLYCKVNLSGNKLSGTIPRELGKLSRNASIDVSNNNLTGPIPQSGALKSQSPQSFMGNQGLCGPPLKTVCTIPSTLSNPPNNTSSPSAIAADPRLNKHKGLRKSTITAIIVGDVAGISLLCAAFLYRYYCARGKKQDPAAAASGGHGFAANSVAGNNPDYSSSSGRVGAGFFCMKKVDEVSEGSSSENGDQQHHQQGTLVTVAGDIDLELDKLLKASAYILGATGYTILYKAVLEDGLIFAVRRLGEGGLERFKEFEAEVKSIGKVKHPNIVRLRGFYWSLEEKLLIYDYIPNGSLAHAYYGRSSNSPYYLPWAARLKIAKGVARGLAYLHERKLVHGNIKPSNILLGFDMEPHIADFGLDKLLDTASIKYSSSSAMQLRSFDGVLSGSKRSTGSKDSLQTTPDMINSPGTSKNFISPYQAPEALKTLKPHYKWDVYSYGIVIIEMLTGKPYGDKDMASWSHNFLNDRSRMFRFLDPTLRPEVEDKDEAVSLCLSLALSCASASPNKRPSMKDVLHSLEKIPTPSQLVPTSIIDAL